MRHAWRGFRRYKIQERYPWEEAGVDGKVLTEFEDSEDLIHLIQDREKQWTPVTRVMNRRVPCNAGNSLTNWETVSLPMNFLNRVALFSQLCEQCSRKFLEAIFATKQNEQEINIQERRRFPSHFVPVFRFHVKHIPFTGDSLHYFSTYILKRRDILWGEVIYNKFRRPWMKKPSHPDASKNEPCSFTTPQQKQWRQ